MTWIAFLTDTAPDGDYAGARHEIVLEGKGRVLRVVELPDGEEAAPPAGAVVMRCVLNRHHEDER